MDELCVAAARAAEVEMGKYHIADTVVEVSQKLSRLSPENGT